MPSTGVRLFATLQHPSTAAQRSSRLATRGHQLWQLCMRSNRPPPTVGSSKTSALASHSDRTPADGSAGLAHRGSCHAHTVNPCPTSTAGGSNLRDHAVRRRNRRRRHGLRRGSNQKGEASNSNQPDHHSVPLLTVQSLRPVPARGWSGSRVQAVPPRVVAQRLDIDQGPYDDRRNLL